MPVKQIWTVLPLPAKLKLFWERVTFSKLTTIYFTFSVLHCIVQIVLQSQAFSINAQAATLLQSIIDQGNATNTGFPVFGDTDLRWCEKVPTALSASSCQVIYPKPANSSQANNAVNTSSSSIQASSSSAVSASSTVVSASTSSSVSASSSAPASLALSASEAAATSSGIRTLTGSSSASKSGPTTTVVLQGSPVAIGADFTSTIGAEAASSTAGSKERMKRDHMDTTITAVNINGQTQVKINGLGHHDETATLDQACLVALNWPVVILDNTKREDITFIAFQAWVLGMSIVALLNESIPHIIASLLTHALATGWAGYQIRNTSHFHDEFQQLITNGACKPTSLLPTYWQMRGEAEIPSLALNGAALLISGFLSWRLFKLFGWQTFKRVGASISINRIYKVVLSLSITIQLSLFFVVASAGLWIDQLINGAIGSLSEDPMLYKALLIVVFVLLVPWLTIGWFAVRREQKSAMIFFIGLSFFYMGGWASMFSAPTFRWTFVQWRLFSIVASASMLLTALTFALGIACRCNFGKGLPRYLNAEESLPDEFVSFSGSEKEKVAFPDSNLPLPTYSAAFGKGAEVPPPSQMRLALPPRQRGPRFYNLDAPSFDPQPNSAVPSETSTLDHAPSAIPYPSRTHVARQASVGSQRSYSSTGSNDSSRYEHSRQGSQSSGYGSRPAAPGKRWILE